MDPHADVLLAMRCLIDHWSQFPQACDTVDGIHRWWLGPDLGATTSDVAAALAWLELHGAIDSRAAADGRVRFRRSAAFERRALRRLADEAWRRTLPDSEPPPWPSNGAH
jgi:hypothetical protein